MCYPYDFEELVLVDLPPDDRHPLYQRPAVDGAVSTSRGPVRYRYHSMVDLSRYDSSSFDLVYSGQTIEHVTEADADLMLKEIHRVLRPGGVFALDTPNGRACRLQQDEFIDPDHKIEYTAAQLEAKLVAADFRIDRSWGLNHVGASLASGTFSLEEAARNYGMFAEVADCYLLAYVCRAGCRRLGTERRRPAGRPDLLISITAWRRRPSVAGKFGSGRWAWSPCNPLPHGRRCESRRENYPPAEGGRGAVASGREEFRLPDLSYLTVVGVTAAPAEPCAAKISSSSHALAPIYVKSCSYYGCRGGRCESQAAIAPLGAGYSAVLVSSTVIARKARQEVSPQPPSPGRARRP